MHLAGTSIRGHFPPLKDIEFHFNRHANIFIGQNGTGKTTALRCISPQMSEIIQEWVDNNGKVDRIRSGDWPVVRDNGHVKHMDVCPEIFVGADRNSMPFSNSDARYWNSQRYLPAPSLDVPGRRNPTIQDISEIILAMSDDIYQFDNIRVYHIVKWIYDQNYAMRAANVIFRAYSCAGSISRDIVDIQKYPTTYMGLATTMPKETLPDNWDDLPEWERHNLQNLARPTVTHPAMGIPTFNGMNTLFMGALSSGTQGLFGWILYLALKLAAFNRFEEGWEDKPAILFVDEIENHLHPTWQRRVIPTLLEYFPNLQIFGATHSPFVVAGLRAGQVHLLKREQPGAVTTTTNSEDVVGWTADEILRAWMEVDEPTDLLTLKRRDRMLELSNKVDLDDKEEIELTTLREQINESLLSRDGPVEAQQERYSDLMRRFLQARQSDLN